MVGYIYLMTDTTNGMRYTGKHHYDKEGELDPNYHGSGTIISKIYKKRPETINEEYIKTCYSESEMSDDEKHYIKVFDTLYPNGYNLTEGGDGVIPCEETKKKMSVNRSGKCIGENHPMFGKHHSEESKNKISEANKGKHRSEETRKKLSESLKGKLKGKPMSEETKRKLSDSLKGRIAPNKGKQMSEEQKKKLSESHKGKSNIKLSKRVLQLSLTGELIREWESAAECGRNGFNRVHVCNCCNGKRKSHKGFKWKYKEV